MDMISLITAIIELIAKITGNKAIGESLRRKWAIFSNLPRRPADFVGRAPEKQKAHRALCSEYPIVSLEGPGGVGKSRLALQVADECQRASRWRFWPPNRAHFGAFIWVSDENQTLTLSNLLDTIALTLQENSLSQLGLEQKRHQVLQGMQKKPCLLIVDNFETLAERQSVQQFLKELPSKCKVLITSRERENFSEIVSIQVGELSQADGLELIRSEAQRAGLASLHDQSDETLAALLKVTAGYPLAIKWALGQIKQEGQGLDEVAQALQTGHANIFQRMFDRSWKLLSAETRSLLAVFPLFSASANLPALQAVSGLGEATSTLLGTLVRMALVDASEQDLRNRRYAIHPLTRAYLLNLPESAALKSDATERMAEYFTDILGKYQDWRTNDPDYSALEPDVANLYQAMNLCLDEGHYLRAYKILGFSVRYLFLQSSWDLLLAVTLRMVQAAQDASDEAVWGHILAWPIASIYRHRRELDLALETISQAIELLEKNRAELKDEKYLIDAWRQKGRVLHEAGEWNEAKLYLKKAYDHYLESSENEWNRSMLSLNLAELEVAQNNIEPANDWAQKAELLIKKFKDNERVATLELIKGQICLARAEYGLAIEHFNESLEKSKRLKRQDSIADSYYWLAQAELAGSNTKKARNNLLKALPIYESMEIHERVQEIRKRLETL